MPKVTLHEGDNRASLKLLADDSIDSVVTDPPYGLTSITKRHGKPDAKPPKFAKDGSFARLSAGFMGKIWDGTGIERDPDFWAEIYRVLKPGGYVFAFSGSRTGHWQACAMEMAGFVMHPMHGWTNSQGFPKAHNASKAIDKMLGAEREVVAQVRVKGGGTEHINRSNAEKHGYRPDGYQKGENVLDVTAPATPEAAQWEGWAYGTQAQKPALEPIYLGQKPFSEKTGAANLLKHGVGAVNIDGCRVPYEADSRLLKGGSYGGNRAGAAGSSMFGTGDADVSYESGVPQGGRHPANLILDGSPEVVAMFPAKAGAAAPVKGTEKSSTGDENANCYGKYGRVASVHHGDSGSAARFYHQFPSTEEDYDLAALAGLIGENRGDCIISNPKAGKADRAGSRHPTVKPIALMQYLIRHITPPGGVVLDPFAGSGTTGVAAQREGFDCILMEAEPEYIDFLNDRFALRRTAPAAFADLLGDVPMPFEDLL